MNAENGLTRYLDKKRNPQKYREKRNAFWSLVFQLSILVLFFGGIITLWVTSPRTPTIPAPDYTIGNIRIGQTVPLFNYAYQGWYYSFAFTKKNGDVYWIDSINDSNTEATATIRVKTSPSYHRLMLKRLPNVSNSQDTQAVYLLMIPN